MFLIILKILFLLAVTSATGKYLKDDELPELEWPKEYSLEISKLSLTSGSVEDMKIWRTRGKSRIDYNKGATKSIVIKKKSSSVGTKYQIHPKTTEDYTNLLLCTKTKGSMDDPIQLEDLLPNTNYFDHVGKDVMENGEVHKFVEETSDLTETVKKYIWASLSNNSNWIPVKIENFEYNPWLGALTSHTVSYINNFEEKVDSSVFKIEKYNCTEPDGDDDNEKSFHVNEKYHIDRAFNTFKTKYNRQYKDEAEHEKRRKIFENNLRIIQTHKVKNSTFTLGITKFADRTPEEIKKVKGLKRTKERVVGNIPFPYTKSQVSEISETLPKEFDLRMMGFVTPVKDQEDCGCCWTMGTTSAVEGVLARKNGGRLLKLANQALIDCAWGFDVAGCDGGTDTGAYHWMMKHGLPTEEEYGPYNNQDDFCRIQNMTKLYPIKGFTDVTPNSVEALKVALVNHGPLSVSIQATGFLLSYTGGIFYDNECDPSSLDHEVTLVGYGESEGEPYWIVKNSWGINWGIDGYFLISTRDSSCGITVEPTYPVL